jgi:lysophospholipase L1-like esterase
MVFGVPGGVRALSELPFQGAPPSFGLDAQPSVKQESMTTEAPAQGSPSDEIQFSRTKTVVYATVSVLLGLLAIEVVCAVIWATIVPDRFEDQSEVPIQFGMVNWPDIVEKDPWLFWQLKANATAPLDQGKMTGFIANGDHMRNPEVPVEREPNDFRVLCLGDSITFGWGVRYEEAYPTLLADLLREARPGREIHVMNAACSGYSAHQGTEMLRRRGLKYRPDVVTIWFGWNGAKRWDGMTDAEHARLFVREHLLTSSATYRVLSHTLRRSAHEGVAEEREKTGAGLQRVPLADYKARLQEMVELARANQVSPGRGAHVVFIQGCKVKHIRAAREQDGEVKLNPYHRATAEVAEQLGVPMLSVFDALYQAGVGEEVFLDNGHLDPTGLRIIADALFALMAEHDMLPEPLAAPGAQAARSGL